MRSIVRFKKIISLLILSSVFIACEKETTPLTMDDAIRKVERIIKKYPDRGWYASKNIVEPKTVLQYSEWGIVMELPELMHEYVSPDYRAWLIVLGEEITNTTVKSRECLHLFVNVNTGKYEQVWLDGRVILEWGSDPFSRFSESTGGQ